MEWVNIKSSRTKSLEQHWCDTYKNYRLGAWCTLTSGISFSWPNCDKVREVFTTESVGALHELYFDSLGKSFEQCTTMLSRKTKTIRSYKNESALSVRFFTLRSCTLPLRMPRASRSRIVGLIARILEVFTRVSLKTGRMRVNVSHDVILVTNLSRNY